MGTQRREFIRIIIPRVWHPVSESPTHFVQSILCGVHPRYVWVIPGFYIHRKNHNDLKITLVVKSCLLMPPIVYWNIILLSDSELFNHTQCLHKLAPNRILRNSTNTNEMLKKRDHDTVKPHEKKIGEKNYAIYSYSELIVELYNTDLS